MSMGQATLVAFSGTLQKSGEISAFLSVDPLTLPPHFAGKFQPLGLAFPATPRGSGGFWFR